MCRVVRKYATAAEKAANSRITNKVIAMIYYKANKLCRLSNINAIKTITTFKSAILI